MGIETAIATAVTAGASIIGGSKSAKAAAAAGDTQAAAALESAAVQREIFQQTREDQAPWRTAGGIALQEVADLFGLGSIGPNVYAGASVPAGGLNLASVHGQNPLESVSQLESAASAAGLPGFNEFLQGRSDLKQATQGDREFAANEYRDFLNRARGTDDTGTRAERADAALDRFRTSPSYEFRVEQGQNALDRSAAARGGLISGGALKDATRFGQEMGSLEFDNYVNRLMGVAGIGQSANNTLASVGQSAAQGIGQATENAGAARASSYVGQANAFNQGLSGVTNALNFGLGNFGGPKKNGLF